MLEKNQLAAATVFTAGVMLLLADLVDVMDVSVLQYLLIVAGGAALAVISLVSKKEKSLLCRVGLHKYNRTGWDDEMPSAAIYQCDQCGRRKRVVKAG
ncbi:hypothetical protein [Alteribacter natronophilus]|uniref:hypothetical protein n=1 Tax=Alteribacter natronophilus TaxID=2583810 RepID=UPI00110D6C2C|nr:hypothetical protein [Alteribacter natronophilus]TMW70992.1 hypothetical protein FGB90_13540 [Alteribacter natronophilus]